VSTIKQKENVFLTNATILKSTKTASKTILDSSFQNNKAMKFENYTSRKFNYLNRDSPDVISYIEPQRYNYKHVTVKVRKEKKDNINDLGKNNIPAANQYYPKFNYVQSPIKNCNICCLIIKAIMYNHKPARSNRYIIQKLWHSHDVSLGYKTVKLNTIADHERADKK